MPPESETPSRYSREKADDNADWMAQSKRSVSWNRDEKPHNKD